MQALTDSYLIEIAEQIAFPSAFLGGFAATFLATLVVVSSSTRVAGWIIGWAATAACGFVIAVTASIMLTIVLHPDVPGNVSSGSSVDTARIVSTFGFSVGIFALPVSVGICGWLRSRQSGLTTSAVSLVSLIIVSWALGGVG